MVVGMGNTESPDDDLEDGVLVEAVPHDRKIANAGAGKWRGVSEALLIARGGPGCCETTVKPLNKLNITC